MISSANQSAGSRPVAAGDTPWARLKEFLLSHRRDIMTYEPTNETGIHLYSLGDWWLAFDRSAHRLCTIFPDAPVSVFRFPDSDTSMTMAHISAASFRDLVSARTVRTIAPDHIVIPTPMLSPGEYRLWRNSKLEENGFIPTGMTLVNKQMR